MTNLAEHPVLILRNSRSLKPRLKATTQVLRCSDRRWPAVFAALNILRAGNRRSVRIVDTDCKNGELLLCTVRQASALGFTAIEALGVDDAFASVGFAQASAAHLNDPAIGISFEVIDLVSVLANESDFPADILIAHDFARSDPRVADLLDSAGRILIIDAEDQVDVAA